MKIGLTGHRVLAWPGDWAWVSEALEKAISDLGAEEFEAINSLAIGADQLFSEIAIRRGGRLGVVVPFAGYESTFSAEELPGYRRLLGQAHWREVLNVPGSNRDAFLAAGHRVVDLSDVLIAVWDGRPAKGKGGTGDAVAYARQAGQRVVHINTETKVTLAG